MPCGTKGKKTKWVAVVVAAEGYLLLGGVPWTEFSAQENKADAEFLAKQCKETNEEAGRKVARAYVREYRPIGNLAHKRGYGRPSRLSR